MWETALEVLFDTIPGKAWTKVNFVSPSEEPAKNPSKNAAKVQLGEPMTFIAVAYRSMDKGLLTGAEVTHQSPPQREWQLMKAGTRAHTVQSAGSSSRRVTLSDS